MGAAQISSIGWRGGFVVQEVLSTAIFWALFLHLNKRYDAWKYNSSKCIGMSSLFLTILGTSRHRWDDNIKAAR
jgi:hypothetical protein